MARKQKSSSSLTALALESLGQPRSKTLLAQRGMRIYDKPSLTKKCYLCRSYGSLDNQLIPRWVSKETMVVICAGCYERSEGWEKKDKKVSALAWFKSDAVELLATKALTKKAETKWGRG